MLAMNPLDELRNIVNPREVRVERGWLARRRLVAEADRPVASAIEVRGKLGRNPAAIVGDDDNPGPIQTGCLRGRRHEEGPEYEPANGLLVRRAIKRALITLRPSAAGVSFDRDGFRR